MGIKKRIFYIDEIRAIAILFVLLIHVSKWFARVEAQNTLFWSFSSSLAALGNVGVPLFFMISGALLLNRNYKIRDFLERRLLRIFIPFVFWIIVAILLRIYLNPSLASFDFAISRIFEGGYVWFIWMLFGIYLISPVINSFIKEFGLDGNKYFLFIWLITTILVTLKMYPFKKIELSYFAGFIGYFILGYYLNNINLKLSDKSILIFSLIVFIISTLFVVFLINENIIKIWPSFYRTIFPVIQASSLFVFFKYFEHYCDLNQKSLWSSFYDYIRNSSIGRSITSISICSYGIYLTHYLFIWIIKFISDHYFQIFLRNPFKWIPFILIIVLVCSWGLILLFTKIPYLKKFSGV